MEDQFDKVLYLIVGIIYFFLKNSNSRNADTQPVAGKRAKHLPAPTSNTNRPDIWTSEVQEVPIAKKPLLKNKIDEVPPHPGQTPLAKAITQQPTDKKVDRMLRRYSSWKKVMIMSELIRPYC